MFLKRIYRSSIIVILVILLSFVCKVPGSSAENNADGQKWNFEVVDSLIAPSGTSIAVDSYGHPHIAYIDVETGYVKHAWRDEHTWRIDEVDLSHQNALSNFPLIPRITLDHNNIPYIVYLGADNRLNVANKLDSSLIITSITSGSLEHYAIDIDPYNHPRVVYIRRHSGNLWNIEQAFWDGIEWTNEIITTGGGTASGVGYLSLEFDSNGYPQIIYLSTGYNNHMHYMRWNGASWFDSSWYVSRGYYPSFSLDSKNNAHICYGGEGFNWSELQYARWTEGSMATELVDESGSSTAIDADIEGKPHIVYGGCKYATHDGSQWKKETIDPNGRNPSIAISSNRIHISYYDYVKYNLKYAERSYFSDILPDLSLDYLDISFSNYNPSEGEIITISAIIHNIGDAAADNVTIRFFDGYPVNGVQIGTEQIAGLLTPGESKVVNVEWQVKTGIHSIYVVVDPPNMIQEKREDNNISFKPIFISVTALADLMALEEKLYFKAMETIDLQGDNVARITADCFIDVFSDSFEYSIDQLMANDDFINKLSIKLGISREELEGILDSDDFKKAEGEVEEIARGFLNEAIHEHFVESLTSSYKDKINDQHHEFLSYISQYGGQFSLSRITKCEEGLKASIDALEEAQRFNTGSWNPFERLPFVYLGYRPCQINRVSMAICAYDWSDSSYLADLASVVYKISGGGVGGLITDFGIKPGVVLASFPAIVTDAHNVWAGYGYIFSSIKGVNPFHSNLIDNSSITPISIISSTFSGLANLHAYDSQGRHVGLNESGDLEIIIPDAHFLHDSEKQTDKIIIFDVSDTISFNIKSFDIGSFDFRSTIQDPVTIKKINHNEIEFLVENASAQILIGPDISDYNLHLDRDGDENYDITLSPSSSVTNFVPNAIIDSPSNEDTFYMGIPIYFLGIGEDNEDGDLPGSSLIWVSSLDGKIGTGLTFNKSNLSLGEHRITLTVIDNEGLAHTSEIYIKIIIRKGDINNDEVTDITDSIIALQVISGINPLGVRSDYYNSGTDVNGDGKVGMEEVIYILEKTSGLR